MIWNILKKQDLTVMLPYRFTREATYAFINLIIDENYDSRCDKLVFDFSNLNFIDPAGVTVLSNLIEFLKLSKVKVVFKSFNVNSTNENAIMYLDDSGFFNHYLNKTLRQHAGVRSTTLPLELVEYSKSYEYMGFRLLPWLASSLNVNEQALATIKVCFQEIYNNIKDHSQVKVGCSFAQYYPQKREIILTVSDFGVGIPFNVVKHNPQLSDHDAIDKACEEGYTTQTTGRNRGAGLDVLIKNVVQKNGGTLIIQSRHGIVHCLKRDGLVTRIPREANGFYPGTLIYIKLDINNFVYDEFDEEVDKDFSW